MVKPFFRRFVLILFGFAVIGGLWLIVDTPVEPGRTLNGMVTQSVFVPARHSGGYTRIVVRIKGNVMIVFRRYGSSQLKPGMLVNVQLRERRLSKINNYTLLY